MSLFRLQLGPCVRPCTGRVRGSGESLPEKRSQELQKKKHFLPGSRGWGEPRLELKGEKRPPLLLLASDV